jgi:hypothetical protein
VITALSRRDLEGQGSTVENPCVMNTSVHTAVSCSVPEDVLDKFKNKQCGLDLVKRADDDTCSFYKYKTNGVLECQARECGMFNFGLFWPCVLYGGVAGGFLIFLLSECTCAPSGELRFHARRLAKQDEEDAQDMFDQAAGDNDQDETLDLTDGINEGEEGVIIQLLVQYLDKKTEEKNPERHKNLAWFFTLLMFIKKLGLKLIVVGPLLHNSNTLSAISYIMDVLIFLIFGAKGKYFPGSLFNEVKALWSGRKFKKVAPAPKVSDAAHY